MPPATTTTAPAPQRQQSAAPAALVPFTRAAREHVEPFVDVSQVLTGSSTQLPPQDVPAYGFLRGIYLHVVATGGAGAAVAAEDAPFSAIQTVVLADVNGAPIVGPLSGFDLYLLSKWGGYRATADARQHPAHQGVQGSGNFAFVLRLPVEVNGRDALGSLANQNASSTYKLTVTLAAASSIYTTLPTTLPTVRFRASLEAWTQPAATDLRGNPCATMPPAHGTTSYWSKTSIVVGQGAQTIRLPRVGSYLRNLIFVWRDNAGARIAAAGNFPDPAQVYYDTRLLSNIGRDLWRGQMVERSDYTGAADGARGLDSGVFVYDFAHDFDGRLGHELRDQWLPTVQSTRLEIVGTFGAAGQLTVLTNDVAPAGDIFV